MNLTKEQEEALQSGESIEVEIGGTTCVILPKTKFDRLVEERFSPPETYASVLKAIDKDDENPEQYLEYVKDA